MFWWLLHDIPAPDGTPAMPGVADQLQLHQIWALIDLVRARNAGPAMRETCTSPHLVPLPDFPVDCPGRPANVETLHSQVGSFVTGPIGAPSPGVLTLRLGNGAPIRGWTGCTATGPAARDDVAILAGQSPDRLGGTQLLVDLVGWLRRIRMPAALKQWDSPAALAGEMHGMLAEPLPGAGNGSNLH